MAGWRGSFSVEKCSKRDDLAGADVDGASTNEARYKSYSRPRRKLPLVQAIALPHRHPGDVGVNMQAAGDFMESLVADHDDLVGSDGDMPLQVFDRLFQPIIVLA